MLRSMLVGVSSFLMLFFASEVLAKRYGSEICEQEQYNCYKVQKGDNWQKLFPDEDERLAVMKINRMNVGLYKGLVIAVPKEYTGNYLDYAPFAKSVDATGSRYIVVDKSDLAFGAYDENGQLVYWGPVSTGKGYCPDVRRGCGTPTGQFAIYSKGGSGCVSHKFPVGRGGAPMPYCMFFHGGYALHGSYDVPGYNASHGCVRMYKEDARWLNQIFTDGYSKVNVKVQE